jgi:hypothetical protein
MSAPTDRDRERAREIVSITFGIPIEQLGGPVNCETMFALEAISSALAHAREEERERCAEFAATFELPLPLSPSERAVVRSLAAALRARASA